MAIIHGLQPLQPGLVNPAVMLQGMIAHGPRMPIEVSLPDPLIEILSREEKPIPRSVSGSILIDTGAGVTCISDRVMQSLGIQPISTIRMGSAAGSNPHNVYPSKLTFPLANGLTLFWLVVGVDLSGQTLDGQPELIGLIGRDFLVNTLLVYDGTLGMFTLALK